MRGHGNGNGQARGTAKGQSLGRELPGALVALMNPQFTAAREKAMAQRNHSDPVIAFRYHDMMTRKLLEGVGHE